MFRINIKLFNITSFILVFLETQKSKLIFNFDKN